MSTATYPLITAVAIFAVIRQKIIPEINNYYNAQTEWAKGVVVVGVGRERACSEIFKWNILWEHGALRLE